ncbi:hypothetical protein [Aurantimonas sp. A2-1-M11]|uniref:hypothetical protein n=1 Tax=Aurantimonas sp. A2-1-M11 TaxID=3113712 RepID=UPI003FA53937
MPNSAVERTVAPFRRELVAAARATVRFETRPGVQLQIDFGERRVEIGGVATKVFFFVATLGYYRRLRQGFQAREAGELVCRDGKRVSVLRWRSLLLGPPGVGKTHLAVEDKGESAQKHEDGRGNKQSVVVEESH